MTYAAAKPRAAAPSCDTEARIHAHLSLVRRLAWHVHGRASGGGELEELVQAGMVALVEAARAFEDRGFEFATYASVRIKGAMIDHLRRGSGRSRASSAVRRAIESARRSVEGADVGAATAPRIAARLGVPLDRYFAMEAEAAGGPPLALDDVYCDESLAFCDETERPDDMFDRAARLGCLRDGIAALDARSQLVLQLYFFEELNLEEIGRTLSIGAARVCQIKKAALARLRMIPGLTGLMP